MGEWVGWVLAYVLPQDFPFFSEEKLRNWDKLPGRREGMVEHI
jgi:hypothetical protein